MQALTQARLELIYLVITIDINSLTGTVDDDLAVVALAEMLFDLGEEFFVDLAVEVVGQLAEKVGAVHVVASDF
jgi:hypothetical protein